MGNAYLSNISNFFVRQLYARGKVSIDQCARAMLAKGETLHASHGGSGDGGTLRFRLQAVIASLQHPQAYGYQLAGPIIEPVLSVWFGDRSAITKGARRLL